jgi:hypothetical protein
MTGGTIVKCDDCGVKDPTVNYCELLKGYFCPVCSHRLTAQRRRDAGAFL